MLELQQQTANDCFWLLLLMILASRLSDGRQIPETIHLETLHVPESISVGDVLVDYRSTLRDRRLLVKGDGTLDDSTSVSFTLLRSPPDDLLHFDHELSRLIVSRSLDRETICPVHCNCNKCDLHLELMLEVKRTLNDEYPVYFLLKHTIQVSDLNDNFPSFSKNKFDLVLSESTPTGTAIDLPCANDPDSPQFGIHRISLKHPSKHFDLEDKLKEGSHCPRLVLVKSLDRERSGFHVLNVCAYELDVNRFDCLTLRVNVTDENDNSPQFDQPDGYTFDVPEDAPIGHVIGRVNAFDLDSTIFNSRISYSIDRNDKISIKERSGKLQLISPLDYELQKSFTFIVTAADHGRPIRLHSSVPVTIRVTNVNDNEPKIELTVGSGRNLRPAPTNACVNLSENAPVGTQIALIRLSDLDDPDGSGLWLQNISSSLPFDIFRLSSSAIYSVRLVRTIDREKREFYTLKFRAWDGHRKGSRHVEQILCIRILDANDNVPVFSRSFYEFEISENNRVNEIVGHLAVSDADSGRNGAVSLDLLNHTDLFVIKGTTLYAIQRLDREKSREYLMDVEARDHGSPNQLSSRASVKVSVLDMNDNSPLLNETNYVIAVEENNLYEGRTIKLFEAVDADDHPFNGVEYFAYPFSNTEDAFLNHFNLNRYTGELTMKKAIDRELVDKVEFTLVVADRHNRTLRSNSTVTVNIIDINDNPPVIMLPVNGSIVCARSADLFDDGLKFVIHDKDKGANGLISFNGLKVRFIPNLSGGGGGGGNVQNAIEDQNLFYVHDGILKLKKPLSNEDESHAFEINAAFSDNGRPTLSAQVNFITIISEEQPNCTELKLAYLKNIQLTKKAHATKTVTTSLFALCGLCGALVFGIYLILMVVRKQFCCLCSQETEDVSSTKSKPTSSSELECNGFSNSYDTVSCHLIRIGEKISTVV
ncbi:hypothetical protein ACOME3_001678 [Neoechinorhynchus agilis]